ncbi:hypothetical protein DFH09DRAFT_194848 [Mycena vulgaris]|nr:hypothetical protein DFH09DRAFT_194848 [Mycena vulgaris]
MALKRPRILAPSAADFPAFGCMDDEAFESINSTLAWICQGSQDRQADRVNYLEQLIFHKSSFDEEKARKFKKLRLDRLPSSNVKWDSLPAAHHMGDTFLRIPDASQDPFAVPPCFLPLSLHRRLKCEGWVKMDVNGDVPGQINEAGPVNFGQYAIEGALSLFSGRIINKSEASLPETAFSSGGRVEHQLYTQGGIWVVVTEFKHSILTNDHAAQLFAGMLSAAEQNSSSEQRVHGMLSNMDYYHFFSYSPSTKKFTQGRNFATGAVGRMKRLEHMVDVINHLFSICLEALRDFIYISKNLSAARRDRDDTSSANAKDVTALPTPPALEDCSSDARKSLPLWQQTYNLICEAQDQLQLPKGTTTLTTEILNNRGEAGLRLLQEGMNALPRLSSIERGPGPKTYDELVTLVDVTSTSHERMLILQWEDERAKED